LAGGFQFCNVFDLIVHTEASVESLLDKAISVPALWHAIGIHANVGNGFA
jgi:hypothetical protein